MKGAGRRRIYLMRHGHVDYFDPALTDPRLAILTDDGRSQAEAARDALKHARFDIAVYSGLPRTRETAEIILAGNEAPPGLDAHEGLEEIKSGWIRATSREELAARLAYSFDGAEAPGACFLPEGETFADAQQRIVAAAAHQPAGIRRGELQGADFRPMSLQRGIRHARSCAARNQLRPRFLRGAAAHQPDRRRRDSGGKRRGAANRAHGYQGPEYDRL